jgi:SAM-dependent methyltransferase
MNTVFKINEEILCGEKLPVDIVANGDDLPLEDESVDYVISSHVFEHFFDPIAALKEWVRVVRPGGYVFIIVPNKAAIPEEDRDPHSVQELIDRHEGRIKREDVYMGAYQNSSVSGLPLNEHGHWTVFSLETLVDLFQHYNYEIVAWEDPDKKVGNGICIVIQK